MGCKCSSNLSLRWEGEEVQNVDDVKQKRKETWREEMCELSSFERLISLLRANGVFS